ncbi:glucose-6-phosphate dehydrogenase, partial [Patescibacteria group bacterium]|nr:glucose-6-phosphate dehydrogenase [Patescibacteria group bacterium]
MPEQDSTKSLLPTVFVIFGATGDLMQKKLAFSLFHLYREGKLPKLFQVVGFANQELTNDTFRTLVQEMIRKKVPT